MQMNGHSNKGDSKFIVRHQYKKCDFQNYLTLNASSQEIDISELFPGNTAL